MAVRRPHGPAPMTRTRWPAQTRPPLYTLWPARLSNLAHTACAFHELSLDFSLKLKKSFSILVGQYHNSLLAILWLLA